MGKFSEFACNEYGQMTGHFKLDQIVHLLLHGRSERFKIILENLQIDIFLFIFKNWLTLFISISIQR